MCCLPATIGVDFVFNLCSSHGRKMKQPASVLLSDCTLQKVVPIMLFVISALEPKYAWTMLGVGCEQVDLCCVSSGPSLQSLRVQSSCSCLNGTAEDTIHGSIKLFNLSRPKACLWPSLSVRGLCHAGAVADAAVRVCKRKATSRVELPAWPCDVIKSFDSASVRVVYTSGTPRERL